MSHHDATSSTESRSLLLSNLNVFSRLNIIFRSDLVHKKGLVKICEIVKQTIYIGNDKSWKISWICTVCMIDELQTIQACEGSHCCRKTGVLAAHCVIGLLNSFQYVRKTIFRACSEIRTTLRRSRRVSTENIFH